ncbi:hypothetical protein D0869_09512 [Hortaea werneckii]|uniref:Uncharacterized protein n=1 Tax=Hortaea werneckii TaxID=91943 RepID=A0A3M6WH87_HORWE|nr:hypothetical protein D0869_09512 [Hortaea werneckii]
MNPAHLPTENRPLFEVELEGMIADAAASRAPTRTIPPEAPTVSNVIHRKRSIPWESETASPASRRPRIDGHEQELPLRVTDSARSEHGEPVHPSGASSLNRPHHSPMQTIRRGPSFVHRLPPTLPHLEGHRLSNPTEATSWKAVHRSWNIKKDNWEHDELSKLRRRVGLRGVNRYVSALGSSSHHDHAFAPSKLPSGSQDREPSPLHRFSFSELPPKIRDRIYKLLLTKDRPIQIDLTWLRPKRTLPQYTFSYQRFRRGGVCYEEKEGDAIVASVE